MDKFRVVLIGNPNCGKSTIFNSLTASKQFIGNWPGVTVDKKTGYFSYKNREIEIIDLPGIYSLNQSNSQDERIAKEFLANGEYDLVVNIIDSSNLARNLYLTTQLMEMQIPLVVGLNMTDVAERKGLAIDEKGFNSLFSISAIKLNARKQQGIEDLKNAIISYSPIITKIDICEKMYPKEIIEVVNNFSKNGASKKWEVLRSLEVNNLVSIGNKIDADFLKLKEDLDAFYDEDVALVIASIRYSFIDEITKQLVFIKHGENVNVSNKLDKIFLNSYIGLPILFVIMYLMFTFSIVFGGALQNFFSLFAEAIFIDLPKVVLNKLHLHPFIDFIVTDAIGGGIQTVITFVPIIGGLYLVLAFLEDSGYLARAAFLIDRNMRTIGLPGKAFFPLVIGFGCNVPAIMAVRGLNSEREKVAVAMMAPFMSCGARLSIYALFCAAFFPNNGQNIVFCLYLIGICVAILTALLLQHTLLKSEPEYLILELPNYHLPTLRGVLVKTYDKLKSFVFGAGKPIVVVFIFLQCFNSVGFDFTFNNQNNGKSVLSIIGKAINPIFAPMGIKEDNWPASVGIFTGIFAKEVLVGSLNSLYSSMGNQADSVTYETNPISKVSLAIKSIPEGVFNIYNNLSNPLWLNLSNHDFTQNFLATEEGTSSRIYQIMRDKFDGKVGAFSYLLFILLYFPCVSVFGVIVKEISMRWAIFSAVWSTSIAYIIAVGFYQCSQLVNRLESLPAVLLSFFIIMLLASFSFRMIKYQKAGG